MAKPKKPRVSEEEELEQAFREITGYPPGEKKKHPFLAAFFVLILLGAVFYLFGDQILSLLFR